MTLHIFSRTRRRWVAVAGVLAVGLAVALAPSVANANSRSDLDSIKHIVVIYEENHSFDNLFGGWEGVNGLGRRPAPRHVDPGRPRDGTALPCLLQNDVNLTSPPAVDRRVTARCRGTTCDSRVRQPAVPASTTTSRRRTRPARRPVSSPPTACRRTARACPAVAPRTWSTASTRSSTRSTAASRTGTSPAATRSASTMGSYDTTRSCRSTSTCTGQDAPNYVDRRQLLPGRVRRFVPQPPVADRRGARRSWPGAVADGGANDLHSVVGADGFPANYPLHPTHRAQGRRADPGRQPGRHLPGARRRADPAGRHGVRRLRRQHDPADVSSRSPRVRPTPASCRR